MYKDRQVISTGEYDLPCPNNCPPASGHSPWDDEDRRRLACFSCCTAPDLFSPRKDRLRQLPCLHDEIGDELISTRVLRSLTLDGVWLVGESKAGSAGCCFGECLGDPAYIIVGCPTSLLSTRAKCTL
jgi:hypothetical protein